MMPRSEFLAAHRRPDYLQRGSGTRPWHGHREPYIALVLDGGYLEAGYDGRYVATTGDALIHRRFDAHSNAYQVNGALVLNLPLRNAIGLPPLLQVPDPDFVARTAEHSLDDAVEIILETGRPAPFGQTDWPDMLAQAIAADTAIVLGEWAERQGLSRETLSRGFAKCFGVTPKRYRVGTKARMAVAALLDRNESLSAIAAASGFADQAHMSREIARLTGHTPLTLGGWHCQSECTDEVLSLRR